MRAMAAILIQSIGMTPGGISPQILIRFNAAILARRFSSSSFARGLTTKKSAYLLSDRRLTSGATANNGASGVIDGFLDRDKSGGRDGMTLEKNGARSATFNEVFWSFVSGR